MATLPVSVVVPLYNKAPFIARALDSIAAQTFGDFEVIVVNDGSTDGGEAIAAGYPDARFRLVSQANAGPGAARNRGAAEARGALIAFLDGDDEWFPEYLRRSLEFMRECGSAPVSVTSGYLLYPGGVPTESMWRSRGMTDGVFRAHPSTPPMRFVHSLAFLSPCSTIVNAETLRRWGGFYEHRCTYGEDAYLWLKVLLNETVAFRLSEPLVRIYTDASGLSGNRVRETPIEPFLAQPDDIRAACPAELKSLLGDFLAIRAFKRACALGYWGQWQEAARLRRRFSVAGEWRLPYWGAALLAGTPAGAAAGWLARTAMKRRPAK